MTKIDIISGFLGAGKTTLIKKLLQEAMTGEKTMLIENEFGEIGIDGGFLKESGIQITEMNSGCICCSLVGDFETSLKEAIETYHPERIMIEPSGVGKLSDVIRAVKVVETDGVVLNSATVVVDAMKVKMYMKNFGEFYNNQIEYAGTIILSRTDKLSESRLEAVIAMLREVNKTAAIITTPWDVLSGAKILESMESGEKLTGQMEAALLKEVAEEHEHHHHHHDEDEEHEHEHHHHHHDEDEEHEHEHHHHHHDEDEEHEHEHHHHHHDEDEEHEHEHHHHHHHEDEEEHHHHHHDEGEHEHEHHHHHYDENGVCSCGHHHGDHEHHHHHADDVFASWGMETPLSFTKAEIEAKLSALENEETYGIILRAKGMVPCAECSEWIYFDYVPGEMDVRTGSAEIIGKICVIGSKIKEDAIATLFSK